MEKKKYSATVIFCIIVAFISLICAFILNGTEKIVSWVVFFVFVVYAFIGYSCENAVKVPDNFVDDKK